MAITGKELAKKLNISAAAVSLALNNKPGISTERKQEIIKAAEKFGYDFTKIKDSDTRQGSVYIVYYKTTHTVLSFNPIFDEWLEGIKNVCQKEHYPVKIIQHYEKTDNLEMTLEELRMSDCSGLMLIGPGVKKEICERFLGLGYPFVMMDSYYESLKCFYVLINNRQGAFDATEYLIASMREQPGYLKSVYRIHNFDEREEGYYKALKKNGMSPSRSVIHLLSPSIENAMADMLEIIDRGDPLARSYFCDNDMIAIGAMKAFQRRGFKIPEDVAFIGFDNISESRVIDPSLTTMDVSRIFLGQQAARILLAQMKSMIPHTFILQVDTHLVKRLSHCILN